jgi:hypothetical protein
MECARSDDLLLRRARSMAVGPLLTSEPAEDPAIGVAVLTMPIFARLWNTPKW